MIGIVGAGISGLALGAELEQCGMDFRIWEAADRPGGVIRSSTVRGRVLDHGPQRMRVTPSVRALVDWSGVDSDPIEVPPELPLFVYRDGRLRRVPFGPGALLQTDLLSARAKLRFALEPLTSAASDEETVAAYFIRKFGPEAYRALFGPLFGGLYGSDPADMLVRHALAGTLRSLGVRRSLVSRFVRGRFGRGRTPPAISFRDGLQAWTDALARRLDARLQLATPVTGIERAGSGWRVRTGRVDPGPDEPATDVCQVDTLVLTIPAGPAARLLRESAPDAAMRLDGLHYNNVIMVHLRADGPMGGLGYQVAFGEALRTRGVTWNAAALDRDGVYTAFLGGARDPGIVDQSDDEIGEIAVEDFRQVTGFAAEVLAVGRTRVPAWDRSWNALDGLQLPDGLLLCTNYESRIGIPGRVDRARRVAELLQGG